jgi:hypothetical protein
MSIPAHPWDAPTPNASIPPVDLTGFDDDFNAAQPQTLEEVPDGKYQVRIEAVKLATSQKSNPMIKWDLIVLSGQHTGRHIFKNSVITPKSLPFVKGDLKTLGLTPAKLSDLPHHLESLLDLKLEVTKRTKGDYTNVYFNKRIEIGPNTDTSAEEKIPF